MRLADEKQLLKNDYLLIFNWFKTRFFVFQTGQAGLQLVWPVCPVGHLSKTIKLDQPDYLKNSKTL